MTREAEKPNLFQSETVLKSGDTLVIRETYNGEDLVDRKVEVQRAAPTQTSRNMMLDHFGGPFTVSTGTF